MDSDVTKAIWLNSMDAAFVGQTILAYQLLDMLVWVHGWPTHPLHDTSKELHRPIHRTAPLDVITRNFTNLSTIPDSVPSRIRQIALGNEEAVLDSSVPVNRSEGAITAHGR